MTSLKNWPFYLIPIFYSQNPLGVVPGPKTNLMLNLNKISTMNPSEGYGKPALFPLEITPRSIKPIKINDKFHNFY